MIGPNELIVIVLVVLVLFGASAIPKFARSLGKAKSEFEKGIKEGKEEGSETSNSETSVTKEHDQ
jgi:sec-independent protein translocase protein TatA